MAETWVAPVLAAAALIIIASGIALTRSGSPYGTAVLTVHKLLALASSVALGVQLYGVAQVAALSAVALTATALAAALVLVGFATGGVISAMERPPRWTVWAHRVESWVALLVCAWWAVLFLS